MNDAEPQVTIQQLNVNGRTFKCRVCGMENSGEPIILLHGFPETSHMWEGVLKFLGNKGYRCLAPDQRGYSPGARPQDVKEYQLDLLSSDVLAFADAVSFEKFHIIGHDWGAACGWTVIKFHPERVMTFSALSVPHLGAFASAKKNDPEQRKKSWYMDFFQLPFIPEILFSIAIALKPSALWQYSSSEEVADYVSVLRKFDALQAIINWYRANYSFTLEYGDVFIPTTTIWGNRDIAIGRAAIEMSEQYMKGDYKLVELDAGHTLVQEKFPTIISEILARLQSYATILASGKINMASPKE
jgi:pimeloyl-ACP methyl ester carboxylesterase